MVVSIFVNNFIIFKKVYKLNTNYKVLNKPLYRKKL